MPESNKNKTTNKEESSKIQLNKLSKEERLQLKDDIDKQDTKEHLESEKRKIRNISCVECKTKLRVDPLKVMKMGTTKNVFECPKDGMLNTVTITYEDEPSLTSANIIVSRKGYGWMVLPPNLMNEQQVKDWLKEENRKIMDNKSQGFRKEEMIIIRALNIALNK